MRIPIRHSLLLFALATALWTTGAGAAQTGNQTIKPAAASTATQSEKAKLTPPPGKMRGTTNEMRKAAAIRNADRKAKAQRNSAITGSKPEAKQ